VTFTKETQQKPIIMSYLHQYTSNICLGMHN
jgi:hypothetical protein